MRKLIVLAALAAFLGCVVGCNTTKGAGRDIERGGEKIQQKASEHGAH